MKINLRNPSNTRRFQEPVTVGIPCPQSSVQSYNQFVFRGHNRTISVQTTPLSLWPDKSVKWLLCDFLVDLDPQERILLTLVPYKSENKRDINYSCNGKRYEVNTGAALFSLDFSTRLPFKQVRVDGQDVLSEDGGQIRLKNEINQTLIASIDTVDVETQGDVRLTFKLSGRFGLNNQLMFRARLHFYANTAKCCMDFTLHNPKSAVHPDGLWDLGDPSSVLFKELVVSLGMDDIHQKDEVQFQISPELQWQTISSNRTLRINQESSGGENWDSPNHCNRDGQIPMRVRGYEVLQDGQVLSKGKRAQPILWAGRGALGLSLVLPRFWQEFPKALGVDSNSLHISLFPECYSDYHELQGGEQKTHSVFFDFSSSQEGAGWGGERLQIFLDPQLINNTKVMRAISCGTGVPQEYQDFLDAALEGRNSFIAKREAVDEYGWRNFGDIYADHEGVNHNGNRPFVSHYNNQYDAIASFYREFYRSGVYDWYELASDLARHVVDIDINHTDQDREEYCNGMFWHTDHYLDAATSSHRMASKEHLKQKDSTVCGGGPGAEHCYTTGLMRHYLFTGDSRFKYAVIKLADWSLLSLKGPQTLLAAVLRTKKKIIRWRSNRGMPSVWSRYPLTRETGNCLNACLDVFELTGNKEYLDSAYDLISGTIHPQDNVINRDLLNAEVNWSYTVFLAATLKYLEKKKEIGEIDIEYCYARDGFLHYLTWMAENEYLTLSKPDCLEFPNETWAAQDLRKGRVLYFGAKYGDDNQQEEFHKKGIYFFKESIAQLSLWETKYLTRPMVLVLQNGWGGTKVTGDDNGFELDLSSWGKSPNHYSLTVVLKRVFNDFKGVLKVTNVRREIAWLRARIR